MLAFVFQECDSENSETIKITFYVSRLLQNISFFIISMNQFGLIKIYSTLFANVVSTSFFGNVDKVLTDLISLLRCVSEMLNSGERYAMHVYALLQQVFALTTASDDVNRRVTDWVILSNREQEQD